MNYLDAAIARMRLGARIDYDDGNDMWWVSSPKLSGMGDAYSRDEAVALYFSTCASLDPDASLPASGSSDGCSATEPPRGGM